MKTPTKIAIGFLVGLVVVVLGFMLYDLQQRSVSISDYIKDGGAMEHEYGGFMSRLRITLTSAYNYMNVKVVVDGRAVFEKSRTYAVDFEYSMGFGWHTVHIIISNPTVFGLGKSILVTGRVWLQVL